MFFANNKIKRGYKPRFTSVENIVNNLHNKGVCNEIEKILLKDQLKFNSLTSVNISGIPQDKINCPYCGSKYKVDVNLIPRVGRTLQCSKCRHSWYFKTKMKVKFDDEEKLFLKDFLLARRIANSGKLNQILIENKLKKKNSFTRFISSCKSDLTRYNVRFYKKGPNIQHELIHEGFEESSETTSDYLNLLSKYISDGSNGLFYEYKVTEGFSLPAFKEETITNILRSCITEIKKTVNNFVISHPSKTNIDWHVARKTDFPKGVLDSN